MLEKFKEIEEKYLKLEEEMGTQEVINNHKLYQEIVRQHKELEGVVTKYRNYRNIQKQISDTKTLIDQEKEEDFKKVAQEELEKLSKEEEKLKNELLLFLIPPDPHADRSAYVEIRQGTGGEEASLFAKDLMRMYVRYAESKGWRVEIVSESVTGMGGYKEVILMISGKGVYQKLKFESGTHRVQRVPLTESGGRIHTSAATVAIMPEVEEVEINIDTKDLRIDTYRASGAGGQHINKTDSAVRITHAPTGLVVSCQDGRSQHQNKEKAMKLLRTRLYEQEEEERRKKEALSRKYQVGTGDRSEKIRTYNFPQGRVTDHRINLTLHKLEDILNGDLDELIEALIEADRMLKLKEHFKLESK